MSEIESQRELVADMIEGIREEFTLIVSELLAETEADITQYATAIASEFGSYLWLAYRGDEVAKQNLEHLKAQALLLMAKSSIRASKQLQAWLVESLAIAARIGIKAILLAIK